MAKAFNTGIPPRTIKELKCLVNIYTLHGMSILSAKFRVTIFCGFRGVALKSWEVK